MPATRSNTPPQAMHFGAEKTPKLHRPSWVFRALNGICIFALCWGGARLTLGCLPEPESPDTLKAQVTKALDFPFPVKVGLHLAVLESLLFFMTHRRSITLAHEVGHTLADRHVAQQRGYDPKTETQHPVLSIYSLKKLISELAAGEALQYSKKHNKSINRLIRRIARAYDKSELHDPKHEKARQDLKQAYRDYGMILVAGPMLEGALMGRKMIGSGGSDYKQRLITTMLVALLEKPLKQWRPLALFRFIRSEMKAHRQAAETYLNSLDPLFLKRLLSGLNQQMAQGKTQWTNQDFEALITQAEEKDPPPQKISFVE